MNPYLEAARPRTLPAAVAPVLVGTAAAATPVDQLDPLRFGLALLVALALQVAVNYANDWFDGVKGVDTVARTGPRRAVASGLITPGAMRNATIAALGVAGVAGLVLALLAGLELLLVGVLAILATLGYSGGSRPYASRGLGEISVFVFFGLVATAGSAYVQDERLTWLPLLAAVPIGATSVALLVVNNLRDIPTDRRSGKLTLAVRLGEHATRRLFQGLLAVALVSLAPIAWRAGSPWPLLGLVSLVTALPAMRRAADVPLGPELVAVLERTGRSLLLLGVGLAAGLVLAG
ncbi:MAG: 1,4-dihydroxy-2-naphthoate polyprenyltransferase [Nitriliruptoraceae bacterium]